MMQIPKFYFTLTPNTKGNKDFLPTRSEPEATGWDVRTVDDIVLKPFEKAKLRLGIRMFAPSGWWLELRPRSSTFAKLDLSCLYGVIDECFENEVLLACQWIPDPRSNLTELKISYGQKIGQVIPVERQEMKVEAVSQEDFDDMCKRRNSTRGLGGFGSTGS